MKKFKRLTSIFLSLTLIFTSVSAAAVGINAYTNGSVADKGYSEGIFTAESTGVGLLAVAIYKQNELIGLELANSSELSGEKLNLIVSKADADSTIKVFRFDDNMKPLCVNKELSFEAFPAEIYVNESFSDNKSFYNIAADFSVVNGKLELNSAGSDGRFSVDAYNVAENIICEVDYEIISASNVKLINVYNGAPISLVRMRDKAMYAGNDSTNPIFNADEIAAMGGKFTLALKMDLKNMLYDIYVNGVPEREGLSLDGKLRDGFKGIMFIIPHSEPNQTNKLSIDNVKVYSGTEFLDLGDRIANVHKTSLKTQSDIYTRPDSVSFAEAAKNIQGPKIIITDDKINEINNSVDSRVIEWREEAKLQADVAIDSACYNYKVNSNNSMSNLEYGIERLINLGLAYLLGDRETKYANRAYMELAVAIRVYKTSPNVRKALDMGELALMSAICYDWMYDGLSTEQRKALEDFALTDIIYPTYAMYHGQKPAIDIDPEAWWDNTNNWNAVCNGGVILCSLAFIQRDMYTTSKLIEAASRGLEYMMASFAPGGAWAEGPGYWAYTMKYLTAAMASIENVMGDVVGFDMAEGFIHTPLYSLSLEGKAGVVNFGDSATAHVNAPAMFYWSRVFNMPEYTAAALWAKESFGFDFNPFDLLYYDSNMNKSGYKAPNSYYFEGTETVSLTTGLGKNDSFIAISGGLGKDSGHGHLDSGAVVVDMKGERVLWDLGAEHYKAPGYFSTNRYKYYRTRPESHNVFVINPTSPSDASGEYYGQATGAYSKIEDYDENALSAVMNLSAAYERDASEALRKIYLDGQDVVIEDSITLKGASDIYWNYFTHEASQITVYDDYAVIEKNGKSFKISFEANADISLSEKAPASYVDIEPESVYKHDYDGIDRLELHIAGSGNIALKTTITNVE